jgi:hypothetical protein
MRISQDVRRQADQLSADQLSADQLSADSEEVARGMQQKAAEFTAAGSRIYLPVAQ